MDTNGDGVIDFTEFISQMTAEPTSDPEEDVREAFRLFDVDGNQAISREELRYTLINLGEMVSEEEVDERLVEADLNGDGYIDYDEFMLMKNTSRRNKVRRIEQKRMLRSPSDTEKAAASDLSVTNVESYLARLVGQYGRPSASEIADYILFKMMETKVGGGRKDVMDTELLKRVMTDTVNEQDMDTMIGVVDLDSDGAISYEEFRELASHYRPGGDSFLSSGDDRASSAAPRLHGGFYSNSFLGSFAPVWNLLVVALLTLRR